jgi:hypothetical protein
MGSVANEAEAARRLGSDKTHLVLAVARFGEADLRGWWRSHGLDGVGEYVLPELFPRTALVAGAELALFSAAKRHVDALPDRDDVVHLFGEPLPAYREAVAWLAELKTGGDQAFLERLRQWSTADSAQSELSGLAGEASTGERIGQTLRLGRVSADLVADEEHSETIVRALAAAYVHQGPDLAVPYYDLA